MMSFAVWEGLEALGRLALIFLSSLGLTLALEKICVSLKLVDQPSERKTQVKPIPRFGGLAFFITAITAISLHGGLPLYFLAAAMLVFVGGLYDDGFTINTVALKFLFQVPAALYFAVSVDLAPVLPDFKTAAIVRFLIFCALFFMTNAGNLMDNMNGLTAGLSILILLSLASLACRLGLADLTYAGVTTAAAILGFFVRNYPRAHIFMGDQGSQFLGFFSTGLFLLVACRGRDQAFSTLETLQIAVALVILFGLFFYDVVTVVRIRIKENRSPFKGDRCHVSHRLTDRGWRPATAVLILLAIQLGLIGATGAWLSLVF